jgi:hypothetical protein
MKISSATMTSAIQAPGWRLKSAQPSATQLQPRAAGTARPEGRKLRAASVSSATGARGSCVWIRCAHCFSFSLTRTVAIAFATIEPSLVLRLGLDEAHGARVLHHARRRREPRAAAPPMNEVLMSMVTTPTESGCSVTRSGAQRHVEERHDHPAVHRCRGCW